MCQLWFSGQCVNYTFMLTLSIQWIGLQIGLNVHIAVAENEISIWRKRLIM